VIGVSLVAKSDRQLSIVPLSSSAANTVNPMRLRRQSFARFMTQLTKFRLVLSVFILGLVFSGITAFPLAWELRAVTQGLGIDPNAPATVHSGMDFWLATVDRGLHETYLMFPWMAYGTDWLAFAHIAIAVYFLGPLVNPVKNEWVLYAGLIGCLMVLPLALICGPMRGIPLSWRLIDCSFGVFGAIPLAYCLRLIRLMKADIRDDSG
jgi:hypothetical protein